jgi:hypothetical protein
MSAERIKLSHISDPQRILDEIALVERLEEAGVHAHSLLKADSNMPDASLIEEIDKAIHEATNTKSNELTYAQGNRIITRRHNRRIASQLMTRYRLG